MRAVRLHGVRDVRLDEIGEPVAPGPDEAVVAPLWCGLCGTDLKAYQDPEGTLAGVPLPLMLGHEFSAYVVAVGSQVRSAQLGEAVAVMPLRHCGACTLCARGEFSLCPHKTWTGLSAASGGLADRALVAGYQLSPLGETPLEAGALVEPAAVAMNAVVRAGIGPGEEVLVVGCGPIGALVIMAAMVAGATAVLATEPNAGRADRAATLGARMLSATAATEVAVAVRVATSGQGVDVALDCAGSEDSLQACLSAVRPGGRVCITAVHRRSRMVDVRALTRANISMVGSLGYTRSVWDHTLRLIQAGRLPVARAVSSRIARADIVKRGFGVLSDGSK